MKIWWAIKHTWIYFSIFLALSMLALKYNAIILLSLVSECLEVSSRLTAFISLYFFKCVASLSPGLTFQSRSYFWLLLVNCWGVNTYLTQKYYNFRLACTSLSPVRICGLYRVTVVSHFIVFCLLACSAQFQRSFVFSSQIRSYWTNITCNYWIKGNKSLSQI